MNKSIYREVFISIVIAIAFVSLLEATSRLLYNPSKLDKILDVLQEKEGIFWSLKPNLDQDFFGEKITTDSNSFRITSNQKNWSSSKVKIAVMGASPSFGWGVKNNETYSSQIALNSNQDITVKNFSQIGYSSFQGRKLAEVVLKEKPTHLLITYVINDLDYYRFFYSQNIEDKEVKTSNSIIISLRNFIKPLTLPKFIFKTITPSNKKHASLDRVNRVSKDDYIDNIDFIVNKARKVGVTPILIKFPVNIHFHENINKDIMKTQNFNIRNQSLVFNNLLEQYATKNNIRLIDFTNIVKSSSEYLFLDPNGDTIHPNKLGHKLFADEVLKFFKKI